MGLSSLGPTFPVVRWSPSERYAKRCSAKRATRALTEWGLAVHVIGEALVPIPM